MNNDYDFQIDLYAARQEHAASLDKEQTNIDVLNMVNRYTRAKFQKQANAHQQCTNIYSYQPSGIVPISLNGLAYNNKRQRSGHAAPPATMPTVVIPSPPLPQPTVVIPTSPPQQQRPETPEIVSSTAICDLKEIARYIVSKRKKQFTNQSRANLFGLPTSSFKNLFWTTNLEAIDPDYEKNLTEVENKWRNCGFRQDPLKQTAGIDFQKVPYIKTAVATFLAYNAIFKYRTAGVAENSSPKALEDFFGENKQFYESVFDSTYGPIIVVPEKTKLLSDLFIQWFLPSGYGLLLKAENNDTNTQIFMTYILNLLLAQANNSNNLDGEIEELLQKDALAFVSSLYKYMKKYENQVIRPMISEPNDSQSVRDRKWKESNLQTDMDNIARGMDIINTALSFRDKAVGWNIIWTAFYNFGRIMATTWDVRRFASLWTDASLLAPNADRHVLETFYDRLLSSRQQIFADIITY